MSYFKLLGLDKEPFSTSPDPDFFYQSKDHTTVLFKLRIAISLKRGMSVVFGEVGTGKTTLMRKLIKQLHQEIDVITKIILAPTAKTEHAFLSALVESFGLNPGFKSTSNLKKSIENFLFDEGLVNNKTIVLFVDEAQKLSEPALEVLRLLLNYETNDKKLIQIVLLGQKELLPVISNLPNLWDRIAFKYIINPIAEKELRQLIDFRLKKAGYSRAHPLFSDKAIGSIYFHTGGYLRKINMICHDALEYLVMHKMENKTIDEEVIQTLISQEVKPEVEDFLALK